MEPGKRLLITGGAGYVGSQLAKNAVSAGLLINILDNADAATGNTLAGNSNVQYFQGSLTDPEIIKHSTADVDYVIHLAGISDGKAGKANPELTKQINIDTLEQLLSISKEAGVQRFIFASTMGVYGNAYKIPLTEDLPLKPIDPYSESKAIGETIVKNANTGSFMTCCLRMAMVYGVSPKMRFDFIVNRLTIDAMQKKHISIMGGSQKRPQIHIDDLSDLFIRFLTIDEKLFANQYYNAVGQNPGIENILTEIQKQIPELTIEKLPMRENEDSFEMDGSKLSGLTDFKFKRDLSTDIKEIIDTYSHLNIT